MKSLENSKPWTNLGFTTPNCAHSWFVKLSSSNWLFRPWLFALIWISFEPHKFNKAGLFRAGLQLELTTRSKSPWTLTIGSSAELIQPKSCIPPAKLITPLILDENPKLPASPSSVPPIEDSLDNIFWGSSSSLSM